MKKYMTSESLEREPVRKNDTIFKAYVKRTWFRKLGLFKSLCANLKPYGHQAPVNDAI